MICETCHGNGRYHNNLLGEMLPCIDCNGSGIMSCCDGAVGTLDVPVKSVAIERLIEEVKNGDIATQGYNRIYNRHNRS